MDVGHLASTAGFTVFIAFMLYRRFKRTVGFQKLKRTRLIFRSVMFGLLGCVFLSFGMFHPINFVADAAGLTAGLILSYYAIKHLRLEKREDGWYYRTHLWIEVTVLAIFVGRIVYRLLAMYMQAPGAFYPAPGADPLQGVANDPLTVAVLFVMISYYIRYFVYLLRKEKQLEPETQAG
jgi:hypothetical protein